MIRRKARSHPRTSQITAALSALLALTALGAARAEANTAANHKIRNTVTVKYDDSQGTAQTAVTSFTEVTVNLVPATPTLNAPTDISTDPATNAVYNYTITTNANGPDSYNLTRTITESAGISGTTATISATPITLGASTVATAGNIAAAGNTAVTVPADSANNGVVNGIAAGDTVVINGQVFTVDSVDDSNGGTASATSTITVVGNGNLTAIVIGDLIRERQDFTLTVDPGNVIATTNQTVTVNLSARDSGSVAAAASDETVTTVAVPSLTVKKYVANVTAPVVGGIDNVTLDTGGGAGNITYYTTGVTGKPGDTLEYVIQITNAAGASQATDLIIEDPIPVFTTYAAGTLRLDPSTGAFGALTDAVDGDKGRFDGGAKKVFIYAGVLGNDGGTGGTLDATKTTYGVFRVTID